MLTLEDNITSKFQVAFRCSAGTVQVWSPLIFYAATLVTCLSATPGENRMPTLEVPYIYSGLYLIATTITRHGSL